MKCCRVQVYLAYRPSGERFAIKAAMTYEPVLARRELTSHGYQWVWFLTPPIGLYPGYKLLKVLENLPWGDWQGLSTRQLGKEVTKRLKRERWLKSWEVELQSEAEIEVLKGEVAPTTVTPEITQTAVLLRGRNLYLSEIQNGLKEMGFGSFSMKQVAEMLIPLLVSGKAEMLPANSPEEQKCFRCGSNHLELGQCGICGSPTWYCPECVKMGESISCRPVFRRADRGELSVREIGNFQPHYEFELSAYQADLSKRLMEALERSEKRDWLLWAVCGAGKTETTFGLIGAILSRGGRVLFTSPRREVVRQMVERFKTAFPHVQIVGLYGGSEEKLTQAQLTIATVHQLVRYYQAFDLVVFDEVDAYPYKGDLRLQSLLQRSRKSEGRLIFLSATPDAGLLEKAAAGEVQILTLPARYHRKGVPVPELRRLRLPVEAVIERMPEEIARWIEESVLKELAQLYIFLPTRRMVETFGTSLQKLYAADEERKDWVQFTHSQDEKRTEKVEGFLRGDFPVLVTTTIMERGVTVPKGNVLVLYADSEIFDSQSLIQMAGRAGRSLIAPHGLVMLAGRTIAKSMEEARSWILKMNHEARERGLLDAENPAKTS